MLTCPLVQGFNASYHNRGIFGKSNDLVVAVSFWLVNIPWYRALCSVYPNCHSSEVCISPCVYVYIYIYTDGQIDR